MQKNLIVKHANAICCALSFICFFFPFVTATMKGYGQKESESLSGYEALFEESGFWGFLVVIALAAILVFDYIKPLEAFKKIGSMAASAVTILALILTSTTATKDINDAKDAAAAWGIDISVVNGVGFWIPMVLAVVMLGIAVIKLLNLKGNPVFDLFNGEAEEASAAQ